MQPTEIDIGRKPSVNRSLERIPVLDLTAYLNGDAGALPALGLELRHALEKVGFFYVTGHQVPQALVDRTFAETERFHALPLEQKLQIKVNRSTNGYLPMKGSAARHSKLNKDPAPNENESFFCRRERDPEDPDVKAGKDFRDPNQWPQGLPGFRENVLEYQTRMEQLGMRMLPVFAAALDLPADYFNPFFENCELTVRLIHYPPASPQQIEAGVFGAGAHTDRGFMTFLAQANVPGLEILTTEGDWIPAPVMPGAFLVNSGDLLRRWTNDRFLSTSHRVLNRANTDRYSVAFFQGPNLNARIECLPTCQDEDNPPKHEPVVVEDARREFMDTNYFHRKGAQAPY